MFPFSPSLSTPSTQTLSKWSKPALEASPPRGLAASALRSPNDLPLPGAVYSRYKSPGTCTRQRLWFRAAHVLNIRLGRLRCHGGSRPALCARQ